jgi:hypothetical protein
MILHARAITRTGRPTDYSLCGILLDRLDGRPFSAIDLQRKTGTAAASDAQVTCLRCLRIMPVYARGDVPWPAPAPERPRPAPSPAATIGGRPRHRPEHEGEAQEAALNALRSEVAAANDRLGALQRQNERLVEVLAVVVSRAGGRVVVPDAELVAAERWTIRTRRDERLLGLVVEVERGD